MPDQPLNELPRIALVYGQEAAVTHVRDAVSGHVEVVYAAGAGEFDVTHMTDARATAALVNLDDGDWLDAIEACLHGAGVAVVYNDPEISRGLDGWERARWLRHLVAKLSGSRDVDPPRPEPAGPQAPLVAAANEVAAPPVAAEDEPAIEAAPAGATLAELPLSPEEIETMTVALAAEHAPANTSLPHGTAAVRQSPADLMAMDMAVDEAAASATGMRPAVSAGTGDGASPTSTTSSADADFDAHDGLDVDTEALSAMIDARLAESEAETRSDSPQVWRVAGGGVVSPVLLEDAGEPAATQSAPVALLATVPAVDPAVPADDADVLASLPSLDDWQLVDPELPVAQAASAGNKIPEPVLPDGLAGLELVPMEAITQVRIHTDPIERWLHESGPANPRTGADTAVEASGGKA